jgi:hypothetical protein
MFTRDTTIGLAGILLLAGTLVVGCDSVGSVESPGISEVSVTQAVDGDTTAAALQEGPTVTASASLTFSVDASNADKCVIWPGDGGRTPANYPDTTAVSLPETDEGGIFQADYTYSSAGSYTLTTVCTSWNYGATESNEVRREASITVN